MNPLELNDMLSGHKRGPGLALLRAGLKITSLPYARITSLRRKMYANGALSSKAAGVPVISVGNITTGGTGKTPMVAWIVSQLQQMGAKPAVLIRGYKSNGGLSDEAEFLSHATGCKVITNPNRVEGAAKAVADGANVLVMDDGFQHLKLKRDLDIVLIDATCPFGFGHVLPRGLLREPLRALSDADAIIITRCEAADENELVLLREKLGKLAPGVSLHEAVHKPLHFIGPDGQQHPLTAVEGRKVFELCGIGNPDAFIATLKNLAVRTVGRAILADHVKYSPQVVEPIRDELAICQPELIVTTQKDYVKLSDVEFACEIWQLVVEMELTNAAEKLVKKLRSVIGV